jgi:UPF0288 family protein (methanogenesis marker protein 3)
MQPDKFDKEQPYAGWHSSIIEYHISKECIEFMIGIDQYDIISVTLVSENSPKAIDFIRRWVALAVQSM